MEGELQRNHGAYRWFSLDGVEMNYISYPIAPGGTILIVDENSTDRNLISEILAKSGYQTLHVSDGDLALQSAKFHLPDLVLLSLSSSPTVTINLGQHLKDDSATESIPIIFMGELAETELKHRAFEAGCAGYITKPIYAPELLIQVKTQITISGAHRELDELSDCLMREVEKRKLSLNFQAESEEILEAITSSVNEAIVMINDLGNITFWNNASSRLFMMSQAEAKGKNFHDLFVPLKYHDKHHKEFGKFKKTGTGPAIGKTLELSAYRTDGTEFPVELSLSSLKLNNVWHAIGFVRDITRRKNNEKEVQKLSFAIEQSANTVVITDLQGKIEYVNPKFTEVTGYTPEEAIGHSPSLLKSGEMSSEGYDTLWSTISSGSSWCGEFHNRKKNGELFWEKTTISPITDETGAIISYLAIKEDVTEQKSAEESRKILEIEMNQARKLESVGSLAAGIAHEINTPIQFVGDNTNFFSESFEALFSLIACCNSIWEEAIAGKDLTNLNLKRVAAEENADLQYLKQEVPTAIEQTLGGVHRVSKIVLAMKTFSHSDQGVMSLSDINDMLSSTLTVAQNELKYVADVETSLDANLPNVECYRDDLNQVFLNLLVNAAHAIRDVVDDTTSEKGVITVSTEHDAEHVLIKIRDTGSGIPAAIQGRIFDPFFSTKDVGKGSGQGLSIARKIVVEKHNGNLDFITEEGQGSTFIIRLPLKVQLTNATPQSNQIEREAIS